MMQEMIKASRMRYGPAAIGVQRGGLCTLLIFNVSGKLIRLEFKKYSSINTGSSVSWFRGALRCNAQRYYMYEDMRFGTNAASSTLKLQHLSFHLNLWSSAAPQSLGEAYRKCIDGYLQVINLVCDPWTHLGKQAGPPLPPRDALCR